MHYCGIQWFHGSVNKKKLKKEVISLKSIKLPNHEIDKNPDFYLGL